MADDQSATSDGNQRCFIVMGFGIKTDHATGRKLDLDKSYRVLIKPVVEANGLICVRADEIRHSGSIDVQMYQELLTADVVIADLSTANPNALYELGVRHALRPWTTIVVSENKLSYPFDLNHVKITCYTHLGDAIDYEEVERFRNVLDSTLKSVVGKRQPDSPVYTYLQRLTPPVLAEQAAEAIAEAGHALEQAGKASDEVTTRSDPGSSGMADQTLSTLIERGEQAVKSGHFAEAKALFRVALDLCEDQPGPVTSNTYLIQRLVLATYKAKQPDEVTALQDAMELLGPLDPAESNDPETVGLAGAIEKHLFMNQQGLEHLNHAIRYYGRGYLLREDQYNGINLAYLLNLRTDTPLDATQEEQIADLVWANRIRREIVALCEEELKEIRQRETRTIPRPLDMMEATRIWEDMKTRDWEHKFWCLATKAEAHFGLGELDDYEAARSDAAALDPAPWMMAILDQHIRRLQTLLEKRGYLLNPPWPGSAARVFATARSDH